MKIIVEEYLMKNYVFKNLKKVSVKKMHCFGIAKKLLKFIMKRSPELDEMSIEISGK